MYRILAGVMAVGVFLVTIGLGKAVISHSEVEAMIQTGPLELVPYIESMNDRTMNGIYLAAVGAGMLVFALLIDGGLREKERAKKRGFFY